MRPIHVERIREASLLLRTAESGVRVLRSIAWEPAVRERFLAAGGRELDGSASELPSNGFTS